MNALKKGRGKSERATKGERLSYKAKNNNIVIKHNLNEQNTENAALKEEVRVVKEEAVKLKSRLKTQNQKLAVLKGKLQWQKW